MKRVDVQISFRVDGKGYDTGKQKLPEELAVLALKEGWAKEVISRKQQVDK